MAGDGPGPFINFVKWFAGENPRMRFDVKRFIAEAIWWPFTAICGYHRRREGPRLWTSSVWRTARLWSTGMCCRKYLRPRRIRTRCSDGTGISRADDPTRCVMTPAPLHGRHRGGATRHRDSARAHESPSLSLNAAQVLERLMERELGLPMAAVPEIVPASAQNGASGANTSQIARSRK
jgi:hypothetical protein